MVLGKLPVPGRPTLLITVGQGLTALAVGAGGGCLDVFTLIYPFSPLSPSLWETARYRLKCCPKGPLNPEQPTNHFPVDRRWHVLWKILCACCIFDFRKSTYFILPILILHNRFYSWLVGCFGFNGPLRQYFSLYRAVS